MLSAVKVWNARCWWGTGYRVSCLQPTAHTAVWATSRSRAFCLKTVCSSGSYWVYWRTADKWMMLQEVWEMSVDVLESIVTESKLTAVLWRMKEATFNSLLSLQGARLSYYTEYGWSITLKDNTGLLHLQSYFCSFWSSHHVFLFISSFMIALYSSQTGQQTQAVSWSDKLWTLFGRNERQKNVSNYSLQAGNRRTHLHAL